MEKNGKASEGPLLARGRCQRGQRGPDVIFGLRGNFDLLSGQNRGDPFRRPAALGDIIDSRKRLQRNKFVRLPAIAPPRSCQSPSIANAAARIDLPKSKAKTCASG